MWPFSSGSSDPEPANPIVNSGNSDLLEALDPSLRSFYKQAEPVKPISLAPKDVKERLLKREEKRKQEIERMSVPFDNSELNSFRQRFSETGGDYIQSLWDAANENCAIIGEKYGECQRNGSMWNVMMSCYKEAEAHKNCLGIQKFALSKVGYDNAVDVNQRNKIKHRLDDLYTAHFPDGSVTDSAKAQFFDEIEQLQNEVKQDTYRV